MKDPANCSQTQAARLIGRYRLPAEISHERVHERYGNPAAPGRAPAGRPAHDRRADDRAGARGRGRQRRFSATAAGRSCRPTMRCFSSTRSSRRSGAPQVPLIVPANEQGAGFMAAGYARASGRVGVCLVTSGPGATNTVTPVRDCMADSVPIVVICGQVAAGCHRHRRLPGGAGRRRMMGAVAKHMFLVTDPARLEATRAHRLRDRPHRAARARWWWICPRTCRTATGVFRGEGHAADARLPRAACASWTRQRADASAAARVSSSCSASRSGR